MIMNTIAKNILRKNTENINTDDVNVMPCGNRILFECYEDNPYRLVERSESGLIIGIESTKKYVSNESGEIENNDEYIVCAKAIEVGPGAKYVQKGDDIFVVKHIAIPVPFRKKGYYIVDEQNVLCRVIKNE